jgi:hypothetical protein
MGNYSETALLGGGPRRGDSAVVVSPLRIPLADGFVFADSMWSWRALMGIRGQSVVLWVCVVTVWRL